MTSAPASRTLSPEEQMQPRPTPLSDPSRRYGKPRPARHRVRSTVPAIALLLALVCGGCARIPVSQQSRLTKPNMVLADTATFGYSGSLQSQIEPGAAVTGGAQAAGCTSCK